MTGFLAVCSALPAAAERQTLLVLWPTVPMPSLKGADTRVLDTVSSLRQDGTFDIEFMIWHDIAEDSVRRRAQ